ncbi:MAG: cytochrome c oxidase subunit II [Candidatus Riflebacteria bacterium]|nr:cytochrome c oxidase subunit II [Candidatus Riflebacteria bacterium]
MIPQILNPMEQIDHTFLIIFSISAFILLGISGLSIYFLFRYHHTRNPDPDPIEGNLLLEFVWTIIPVILVSGMFVSGWTGFKAARTVPVGAYPIKTTARMWAWNFEYPNGKIADTLWVPQGKPIKIILQSLDVIHSFYMPAYRIKMDALPGRETYTWFLPMKTGEFTVFCAEYCGLKHADMSAKVVVATQTEFDEWVNDFTTPGAVVATGPQKILFDKGCLGCHSLDGSVKAGPTFKGIFGRKTFVIKGGQEESLTADEAYLRRSILDPKAEIVKGFPDLMPPPMDISPEDLNTIINCLKSLP